MRMEAHRSDGEEEPILNFRLLAEDFEIVKKVHASEKEKFLGMLGEKRVELTSVQKGLTSLANEGIANILHRYDIDLPERVYKQTDVVPLSFAEYKKVLGQETKQGFPDAEGVYIPEVDKALLWYKENPWHKDVRNQEFLHTVIHGLGHAKSYRALKAFREREEEEKIALVSEYRSGLRIIKLASSEAVLFHSLNEAITETLAIEVTNGIMNANREVFRVEIIQQINWEIEKVWSIKTTKDPRVATMKEKMQKAGWVSGRPSLEWQQEFQKKIFDEYQYAYPAKFQSYKKERGVFERLITTLAEKSEDYKNKEDEIRGLFYHAYFSGRLLTVGRLVEKTLGKGTFRMVAEMGYDKGTKQLSIPKELEDRLNRF